MASGNFSVRLLIQVCLHKRVPLFLLLSVCVSNWILLGTQVCLLKIKENYNNMLVAGPQFTESGLQHTINDF